jgi:prolyl-tRNA synthetase
MRLSHLFSQTLREAPSETESASYQLLLRAGFIRQMAAGIFSYLPLARRSMNKIEQMMRSEMDAIGGQEITMPVVQPGDLWKETGRWYEIGLEMGRLKDRSGRDLALAMTHEEAVADLVRGEIRSHRQLPALIYHIQTKWRDDPRPRAGLIRVREFTMLDSYSLDSTWEGLDRQYRAHYQSYFNLFNRCGLPAYAVRSDTGMMGGRLAHEFMYLSNVGEDTLFFCDNCGFAANRQVARAAKPTPAAEDPAPLEKVATPHATTIAALAEYLDIPESRTAKAVFMMAALTNGQEEREEFVFAVTRGDMEVNETKLANLLGARSLRPATEDEIRSSGAVPGYASPVGLKNVQVVVDELIPLSPNLAAGANEEGYHLLNVNFGRDFTAARVADITAAQEGDDCSVCGSPLHSTRGVEIANIFKLGTRYSTAMGCEFLDETGQLRQVIMGSYGIGVGRLLACIAEEHHDERGLVWPVSVAPYQVHLVGLAGKTGETEKTAAGLYEALTAAGVEVLFDDRAESAGVKFMDADLIGLPVRVTISERSIRQGGAEVKLRSGLEIRIVALDELIPELQATLRSLQAEIDQRVGTVEYPEETA